MAPIALSTIILCVTMLHAADAMQYTVGWTVGADLQQWASQHTFYEGDELYFPYPTGQSSVLLVTEEGYKDCSTSTPETSDGGEGDMVMPLTTAETYYFISGVPDQCSHGLRLAVEVEPAAAPALSPPTHDIPSSPVILTPPHSIGSTPLSTSAGSFRQNSASPSRGGLDLLLQTTALLGLALALAHTWLAL